ncbi:TonB-dependent receptor [Spongiimicrobium salis]|uniref:hypothetical protein n=1 Tax=Spongiimicrobium salis TaxID=1667022 RepID=UPI00374CB824
MTNGNPFIGIKEYGLVVLFLFFGYAMVQGQPADKDQGSTWATTASAEKIYIHLDKTTYAPKETLWFKAIVVQANSHLLETKSDVLYVELIDRFKRLVAVKRLKLEHGIADGFFDIKEEYAPGVHMLRAYTEWNKNFGQDFIFTQYIDILPKNKLELQEVNAEKEKGNITANDEADLNAFFFPESGYMVHQMETKLGFKVISQGAGIPAAGEIITKEGGKVGSFQTNALGMGAIPFVPDANQEYYANIRTADGRAFKTALPKVLRTGTVLNVGEMEGGIGLKIASNRIKNDSIYIQGKSRGQTYYYAKAYIGERKAFLKVAKDIFPEGIVAFTLFDKNKIPLGERLFFVENETYRLHIEADTDREWYRRGEEVTLNVRATGQKNTPKNPDFSVLVIHKDELGTAQLSKQNILSYLLLDSDLRGNIEAPGNYFKKANKHRKNDLDALLLTQGWRGYKYQRQLDSIRFLPEKSLVVSGAVRPTKKGKGIYGNRKVSMMLLGKNPVVLQQETDEKGKFKFPIGIQYGPKLKMVVQLENEEDKKNYGVYLDKKIGPRIIFEPMGNTMVKDSLLQIFAEKNLLKTAIRDSLKLADNTISLDEVIVQSRKLSPKRKEMDALHGEPDIVINEKEIQEKNRKWSYGIYSVLRNSFQGQIEIRNNVGSNGDNISVHVYGATHTFILVDGKPVSLRKLPLVGRIPAEEVVGVEILKSPSNSRKYLADVFNETGVPTELGLISFISIYTRSGKGLLVGRKKTQVQELSVPTFALSKEYYLPLEETGAYVGRGIQEGTPLIYWKPRLMLAENGTASINFDNGNRLGEMLVVLECIDQNGALGYKEITYEVRSGAKY